MGSTTVNQRKAIYDRRCFAEGIHRDYANFFAEVWLPLGVYDLVQNDFATDEKKTVLGDRAGQQLLIIGRLKPGDDRSHSRTRS